MAREAERKETDDRLTAQMRRRMEIVHLLDYYGGLLTEKQRDLLDLHFNQDLSLGEIAELLRVSRQAVHEAIRRGEASLLAFEAKLGFAGKQALWQALIEEIYGWADADETQKARRENWLKQAEALLDGEAAKYGI